MKKVVTKAKKLFKIAPAPWSICEYGIDGYVVDANGKKIFGGELGEGYVGKDDAEIVALVDTINALAIELKGEN